MGRFLEALKVFVIVFVVSACCTIGMAGSSPLRGGAGCGVEKSDWVARLNRLAVIV